MKCNGTEAQNLAVYSEDSSLCILGVVNSLIRGTYHGESEGHDHLKYIGDTVSFDPLNCFILFVPIYVHKLSCSWYFIDENSYTLNKATARGSNFVFFPRPGKENYKYL